jgi:hypothetical protein
MSILTSCMCKNEKSVNPYFISFHTKIWSNEPTMRHKYLTMSPLFLCPLMNLNHLPHHEKERYCVCFFLSLHVQSNAQRWSMSLMKIISNCCGILQLKPNFRIFLYIPYRTLLHYQTVANKYFCINQTRTPTFIFTDFGVVFLDFVLLFDIFHLIIDSAFRLICSLPLSLSYHWRFLQIIACHLSFCQWV